MESEVSLENMASEFLNTFGYSMDAVDFINFLISESNDGIHRLFFAENLQSHEFIYSKMMGMVSAKSQPEELYKAFHAIFDPEIPVGEFGLLTVQSMPFYDAGTVSISEPKPYEIRAYLISHHTIAMYGDSDAQELMANIFCDDKAVFKDAWIYDGMKPNSLRYLNFS